MKNLLIIIILILIVSCSFYRDTNNIDDWSVNYKIGDVFTFDLIDTLYTVYVDDTITVENKKTIEKTFTETIEDISDNAEYKIIKILNEGLYDTNYTYFLIVDRINNNIKISKDSIVDYNDIIILNTPVDSLSYWSTIGFDSNSREYTIIDDKTKKRVGDKYYYELIHIKSNTVDNSIEEFLYSIDYGLIYRKYTEKYIDNRWDSEGFYLEYTHKMQIIFKN